jgi:hypothetical protein
MGVTKTIGGKFDSTGAAADQQRNCQLVTTLMGEIGRDGADLVAIPDQYFLTDCRIKLNESGSKAVFGWRQVEKIVAIAAMVKEIRRQQVQDAH